MAAGEHVEGVDVVVLALRHLGHLRHLRHVPQPRLPLAYPRTVADLTDPCPNCGTLMRWETSHERCDGCGYIRPCCEGAPCH
ncbi:hypothetical protein GCM10022263_27230 [Nocardioides daeguensis]|uniref:Uncharacterized protein n=1 Tax=Nocardioides daeguensis TaxID=908359 RepID=A0ABP6VQJ8_9ACTN